MGVLNRVTIFGGSGFVGRQTVQKLAKSGAVITVVTRSAERVKSLRPLGEVGQIVPMVVPLDDRGLSEAIAGADAVINLLGTVTARARAMEALHFHTAQKIAEIAAAESVKRLVHVSALGASDRSHSVYSRSKFAGAAAGRQAFTRATILSPSLIIGADAALVKQILLMARWLPMVPMIAAETRFQPVQVNDVAEAIRVAATEDFAAGKDYDIGGPEVLTMRQIYGRIMDGVAPSARTIALPTGLALAMARVLQNLPGRAMTVDQIRMTEDATVVGSKALKLADLGITAEGV
ncbi:MAG: complex I NDUFA9 subunit family protein [Candidatus Pacebacteria bacterium]|nr:complex I NDUFA9 subunit family protein [Candidatus Paceibacterota bacterium]